METMARRINIISVFLQLILNPSFPAISWMASVVSAISAPGSSKRAISSAQSRSASFSAGYLELLLGISVIPRLSLSTVVIMTKSMADPNKSGDQISPCLTSVIILNQLEERSFCFHGSVLVGVLNAVDYLQGETINAQDLP